MLWTLAVIADSGRAMYETMVRPLSEAEREDLWQDYVRFGELFGLPAQRGARQLPRVQRLVGRSGSPRPTCRRPRTGWRWRRWSPSSSRCRAPARGNLVAQNHIIKGTLPPRVREIFGIRWSRAHETQLPGDDRGPPPRPPPLPAQVRRGRNDVFFDVVSKTERQRGGTGRRSCTPAPERWRASRPRASRSAGGRCGRRRTASRPPTAARSAASTCRRSASTS